MKMRIISGELKGHLIDVPKSDKIRPTTDRVRETLFNLLNNMIDFTGIKVLDLYAGSGSLGLECLSRGASEVHFVEKDFFIYKNLLKNIESLELQDTSTVFRIPVIKFTKSINEQYDLILADPPFFKFDIYNAYNDIVLNKLLNKSTLLIVERSIQTKEKDITNFNFEPFKIIGDTCLYSKAFR